MTIARARPLGRQRQLVHPVDTEGTGPIAIPDAGIKAQTLLPTGIIRGDLPKQLALHIVERLSRPIALRACATIRHIDSVFSDC